jgi:hypothetical protein
LRRLRKESWQRDATRVNLQVFQRCSRAAQSARSHCGSRRQSAAATANGLKLAQKNSMPVFSGANLIGGLLFGSIGFVAFVYGKRMHVWKPMFLGIALMAYPYFVSSDIALFVIGAIGTAALFLFRD